MRHPSALVLDARTHAGLSQRELARRADTAQSVISRIEGGQTSPSWDTLLRIVGAAGFDLETDLTVRPVVGSHMLKDVGRIPGLSPEARLEELANLSAFADSVRVA